MSDEHDPQRLLAQGAATPARLREVLASADTDSPSAQDLERLTASLAGVLPAVGAAGALATASAAAKGAWKLKLLVGVAVTGAALGGATYYASRTASTDGERLRAGMKSPPVPAVASDSPRDTQLSTPPAASTAARSTPAPPKKAVMPHESARVEATSLGETELLSQAVGALTRGDAARALALSEQHRRQFRAGSYSEEFERVAIEALLRLGDRTRAEARARVFFRRFPGSAHRARLEGLLSRKGRYSP